MTNTNTLLAVTACCALWGAATSASGQEQTGAAATAQVEQGTAAFDATTNLSAITVHGKSEALKGRVRLQRAGDGLLLEQIEAWVPVETLNTGMGLRDEHMRKYIFTAQDGKAPDVRFSGERVKCPPASPGKEVMCKITGKLAIRGVERPFGLALKIKQEGTSVFRAAGDGTVKLSDYGIERPSQFGVKAEDGVKLHVAFTAKQTEGEIANGGAR